MDSVPPSNMPLALSHTLFSQDVRLRGLLTSKRSRDKHRGKTTNATDKGGSGDVPVFSANVMSSGVSTCIDDNTHDDKDLNGNIWLTTFMLMVECGKTYNDGDDLEQTQPIFKLSMSLIKRFFIAQMM